VVALKRSLTAQAPGDQRWIPVEDPSAAAACRAAAATLAGRLEFPAARADKLTLAVTEAASNLHKHARQGSMLLRITRAGGRPGIEMVTIDAGPGLPDAGAAARDGYTTSGTLGIGLGAIRRLACTPPPVTAPCWRPGSGRSPVRTLTRTRGSPGRSPERPNAATSSPRWRRTGR
jgi:anti-sigma regulatory factor (Ser/Thr protein kinase)